MIKNWKFLNAVILVTVSVLFSAQVFAVSFNNDFTQTNDNTTDWLPLTNSANSVTGFPGYPCMTAGTATNNTSASSNIPGCNSSTPDAAGSGSLRLTPAQNYVNSAILSKKTFPTNQGLDVTFTTYTYGGDSGGTAHAGADGMSFFMSDGALGAQVGGVNNLGGNGGALGYSCSNGNNVFDGIEGAYLGLGMDEYGNFLNNGDNTSTGIPAQLAASAANPNLSFNSFGAGNYQPNRIGLRGAGNVRWRWLNANYPVFYPSTLTTSQKASAVKNTCKTGKLWNYSGTPVQTNTVVANYAAIGKGFWVLPDNQLIASQAAKTRAAAWPITYKLRITPTGILNYFYSYNGGAFQPVLENFNLTTDNGALPPEVRFGFSAATGGSTNVHDLSCFSAEPIISNSSASANIIQGQQVKTENQVFLASYDQNDWAGSVAAYDIELLNGVASVRSTATWDTNCRLTGTACQTMANVTQPLQAPTARKLITWNGTAGIPLQWANLTAAQQAILNSTDAAGLDRLNWLRGDRTKEQLAGGVRRVRTGVMGDVINSSPTWVGPPSFNYGTTFNDRLYAASNASAQENITGVETYTTFATNNKTRPHVVYTGSNDGMLHGSRAGANDVNGNFVPTVNNDGQEVLGFMPSTVLANGNIVKTTNPSYSHEYFVDAAPGYGDLFYNGSWRTWMVGGLGAGGAEVYALDITSPTTFSESSAASIVKGSWTPASLTTCTNFTNTTTPTVKTCGTANMGNSYGTPIIRRLHNGKWAVIFGNGIGSADNSAGVFIGVVNPASGAVNFTWLDAKENGTASAPNGISYVTSADIDGDRITDYLYGGDLQGNVWRFDLTSSNQSDWGVTDYSNPNDVPGTVRANPSPLFKAVDSAGTAQPITTRIAVTSTFVGSAQRIILGLATGQTTPLTNSSAVTYQNGVQSVYGIWDWNLSKWNSGSTTVAAVTIPAAALPISSLASAPTTQPIPRSLLSNTSSLLSQTATTRGLQLNTVCWEGSATCGSNNNKYGWLFDMPDRAVVGTTTGYEQVIFNPTFSAGQLVLNTTTPPTSYVGQCKPTLPSGWTMAFNIESGGGTVNSAGQIVNVIASSNISTTAYSQVGMKLNGVGSPFIVSVGSQPNIVTQTNTGTPTIQKFNPSGGVIVKRISWEQLR